MADNNYHSKDDEDVEKDKQTSVFDTDKDMAAPPPMNKMKSVFDTKDEDKDSRSMDGGKDAALGDKSSPSSSSHLGAMDIDKDAHVNSFTGKNEGNVPS